MSVDTESLKIAETDNETDNFLSLCEMHVSYPKFHS